MEAPIVANPVDSWWTFANQEIGSQVEGLIVDLADVGIVQRCGCMGLALETSTEVSCGAVDRDMPSC